MALDPQSLRTQTFQLWTPGDPPEPAGVRADVWALDDQGNVQHKFFDPVAGKWSGWENQGHP